MKSLLRIFLSLLILIPTFANAGPRQVETLLSGLTDSNGEPLNGGKVYTYIAGTTTNKTTWQDNAEATPHANPIILDSNGRKQVYADGNYKFKVTDSADNLLYTWDNLFYSQDQGPATYAGTTTGSANAYVATLSPALLALTNGVTVTLTANFTNTGNATLNVNGIGAISIYDADATPVNAYEILSGHTYTFVYDASGVVWKLVKGAGLTSGSYTPTLTAGANVASQAAFACYYLRINNIVNVGCTINVDPTAAAPTATQLGVSLPIASNFTTVSDLAGACSTNSGTTVAEAGGMFADTTNDRVDLSWMTYNSALHTLHCNFTYVIK